MAMQRKTWSINGLSAELGIDRRTLSRRLAGLPPAEVKRLKNREERRWYLSSVLDHLDNRDRTARADKEMVERFDLMMARDFYPALIDSDGVQKLFINGVMDELGLNRVQAIRAFQILGTALSYSFCEVMEDENLQFRLPDWVVEMNRLGIEGYLEKHGN
jgi:hypothetical protein